MMISLIQDYHTGKPTFKRKIRKSPGIINSSAFPPGWTKLCNMHQEGRTFKLFLVGSGFTGHIGTRELSRVDSAGAMRQGVKSFVKNENCSLKETPNSFKKWSLNLWWSSNKTIIEVENITKAATFNSFLHLSYKNTQLLFLWQCFLIFSWGKH